MDKNLIPSIGLLFITTLIFGGALGYFLGYEHGTSTEEPAPITSFEECAAAGYPVMESYPEQCSTPDGKHFTREIEPEPTDDTSKDGAPGAVPYRPLPVEPVACTMDAKMCPDGTYVGRIGPSCEFAPCPGN